jgi:hypothetical protein
MSRLPAAAVNQEPHVVVDYGVDPRGLGLFGSLTQRITAGLNGARAVVEGNPTWYGYAKVRQITLAGMAGVGSGMGRAIAARNSELTKESTDLTDPSLRILADRMQRGQS